MSTTINPVALRRGRLARLRKELRKLDCAAAVLVDPVNIRYATGARNMQVFMARNPARYLVVFTEGPVILHEFDGCRHLAEDLETIDEIHDAITVSYVAAGPRRDEMATRWARALGGLLRAHGCAGQRIAVERLDWLALSKLDGMGFWLCDAQIAVERARSIKTPDELLCIRQSLDVVQGAVHSLREAIRPGITENDLWSRMHQAVIAGDGDYVETRLLSSGPRTNPWYQESGPRPVEAGDLIALDTDVVGPHGYYVDFSRTFAVGPGRATPAERDLYAVAQEQIAHNLDVLRAGLTFQQFAERAWPIPEAYVDQRYFVLAHGCGMTGEYPYILHKRDLPGVGYDGVIEPGMTLCLESYIGHVGGPYGVKLEEQVLVTETGVEVLSQFPHDGLLQ